MNSYYHNVLIYLCSLKILLSFLLAFPIYSWFHRSVGRCKAFSSSFAWNSSLQSFCIAHMVQNVFALEVFDTMFVGIFIFESRQKPHLKLVDLKLSLVFYFNLAKLYFFNFSRLEDYRSSRKCAKIIPGLKLLNQCQVYVKCS